MSAGQFQRQLGHNHAAKRALTKPKIHAASIRRHFAFSFEDDDPQYA
jgi:hypothetical protein